MSDKREATIEEKETFLTNVFLRAGLSARAHIGTPMSDETLKETAAAHAKDCTRPAQTPSRYPQ